MSQVERVSRAELLTDPPDPGPKLELVDTEEEPLDPPAPTQGTPAAAPWAAPWRPSLGELSRSEPNSPRLRLGLDPERRRRLGQILAVLGAVLILAGLLVAFV